MSSKLTSLEADLLTAAFMPHADALPAWQRFRDSIDWNLHIDAEAFALLPAVHRNLARLGFEDALFARFKGIAKQSWLSNQHRIAGFQNALNECRLAGVDLLLLPPVCRWLAEPSAILGPRNLLRLAIHPLQAELAIRSLLRAGWRFQKVQLPSCLINGYVLGTRYLMLETPDREAVLLSWGLDWWFGQQVSEVWARASCQPLGKQNILGLERTDALEFALRQLPPAGGLGNLGEVLSIVATDQGAIDWQRLERGLGQVPLPLERHKVLAVLLPFFYALGAPPGLRLRCAALLSRPVEPLSRLTVTGRIRQDLNTYFYAFGSRYSPFEAFIQMPGYLMARWQLASPWQLPKGFWNWLNFK